MSGAKRNRHAMLAMFIGVGLNGIATLLMARILGPSGRGELVQLTLIPTALNVLAGGGLPVSNIYLVAKGTLSRRVATANSLAWSVAVPLCIAVVVVGAMWTQLMPRFLDGRYSLAFAVIASSGVLMGYQQCGSILQGVGDFAAILVSRTMQGIGLLVAVAAMHMLSVRSPEAYYVAWISSFALPAAYLAWQARDGGHLVFSAAKLRNSLRLGVAGMWSQIWDMLNFRGDQYIVSAIASPYVLGVYSVGVALTELIFHLPNALAQVAFHESASGRLQSGVLQRAVFVMLTSLAAGAGLLLLTPVVVRYVGSGYSQLPLVVGILVVPTAVLAGSRLLGAHVMGTGSLGAPGWAAIISLLVTLIGDLTLIPRFGVVGAAVAASGGYLVGALILLGFYLRVCRTGRPQTSDDSSPLRRVESPR